MRLQAGVDSKVTASSLNYEWRTKHGVPYLLPEKPMKLVLAVLLGVALCYLGFRYETLARYYELRGSAPDYIAYRLLTLPGEPGFTVHPNPAEPVEREPGDFVDTIQAALKAGHYAELDAMAATYRNPRALFIGGVPKLERFYDALATFGPRSCGCGPGSIAAPQGFTDVEQRLEAWRRANPASIAADLALANIWLASAWKVRGGGYDDTVTDAEWAEMGNRLSEAESYMIDPNPAKDPEVYYLWIEIGKLRSYDRARLDSLYQRAVAQFPDFYPYYPQRVSILETKWYGEPGELAGYLDELRSPEHGDTGQVAYSFAASRVMGENDRGELFSHIGLDFPSVIQAYQTRERLYGLRNHDWNAIFNMSIQALDCQTGHVALVQIGDHWDKGIWGSRKCFTDTVAWLHAHSAY